MRARLIKTITFIAGLYFVLEFLLPAFVLKAIGVESAHESITQGVVLVGTMAAGLGIINLFLVHGAKIAFRRKGYPNSAALLLGLVFMMFVALSDWGATRSVELTGGSLDMLSQFAERIAADSAEGNETSMPAVERVTLLKENTEKELLRLRSEVSSARNESVTLDPIEETFMLEFSRFSNILEASLTTLQAEPEVLQEFSKQLSDTQVAARQFFQHRYEKSTTKKLWDFMFDGLFVSLGSAMFSLLGVYIAAAAFRAFRVRTFESSLMMTAAVLVMLGQIPFGLWIYEGMPDIRQWLLEYPNGASFRAIKIGAAVAMLVMSFRMWLSLESDYSVSEEV